VITHTSWRGGAAAAAALFILQAAAQAPGEDPVIVKGKLSVQMQATGPAPKSGNIENTNGMPAWMRARVTRYEAKAASSDTTGILTDNDVVSTATAEGLQKTCVQEIGSRTVSSTTPGSKYGPNQTSQVVVLRGDVVNICK
jgi:hypothetical protein